MFALRFLYVSMTIFVFAASFFVSPILANSNQETASIAITSAEETVISAYDAVLEAEQAGGNVTGLLADLNKAGEFLAAARMSNRTGDFNNTIYFANLSRSVGEEVENSAYALKFSALNEEVQRMWFTILASVSGIILVVLGSFWGWRFLKKRYH